MHRKYTNEILSSQYRRKSEICKTSFSQILARIFFIHPKYQKNTNNNFRRLPGNFVDLIDFFEATGLTKIWILLLHRNNILRHNLDQF